MYFVGFPKGCMVHQVSVGYIVNLMLNKGASVDTPLKTKFRLALWSSSAIIQEGGGGRLQQIYDVVEDCQNVKQNLVNNKIL